LSSYKRIDVLILDKMMCKLEQMSEVHSAYDGSDNSKAHSNNPIEQREFDFLLDLLGNILQQVLTISEIMVYLSRIDSCCALHPFLTIYVKVKFLANLSYFLCPFR
jgi:hypothetical protein